MKLTIFNNQNLICTGRGGTIISIQIDEILYIKSEKRLLNININQECISIYGKLEELMELLQLDMLLCNRSTAVNMKYIRLINSQIIRLKSGEEFNISRRRKEEIKQKYMEYIKKGLVSTNP